MKPNRPVDHWESDDDIAAACAAYLYNVLPDILLLPPGRQFERLQVHFLACLAARECRPGRTFPPRPGDN